MKIAHWLSRPIVYLRSLVEDYEAASSWWETKEKGDTPSKQSHYTPWRHMGGEEV
jgi:hypothetical protein